MALGTLMALLLLGGFTVPFGTHAPATAAPRVAPSERVRPSSAPLAPAPSRIWRNLSAYDHGAPGRDFGARATWYPPLDGVLVFGGYNLSQQAVVNTTWLVRNGSWEQLHPNASPPATQLGGLVYDPASGYAVLFGGTDANSQFSGQTWTFANGTWTNRTSAVSPGPRSLFGMAYDPGDEQVVLMGGYAGSSALPGTWAFQNGSWSELTGIISPPARAADLMATDTGLGGAVLVGGANLSTGLSYADTWVFYHDRWTNATPSYAPPAGGLVLAADPVSGGVLLLLRGSSPTLGPSWGFTAVSSGTFGSVTGSWTNLTGEVGFAPGYIDSFAASDPGTGAIYLAEGVACLNRGGACTFQTSTWALAFPPQVSSVAASPGSGSIDAGMTARFSATVQGGTGGPYAWTGLPAGCAGVTTTNVTCPAVPAGLYAIEIVVDGAFGSVTSPPLAYQVAPAPSVTSLTASRPTADVGQSVLFETTVFGGSGPLGVTWSGLPNGCASSTPSVVCTFPAAGRYPVSVSTADALGAQASASVNYTVYGDPAVSAPTRTGPAGATGAADVGMPVTFSSTLTLPGSGGPYAYQWSGLPAGCVSANAMNVTCQPTTAESAPVSVAVTDSNGFTALSPVSIFTIGAVLTTVASLLTASPVAGATTLALAQVSGGVAPYSYRWTLPNGTDLAGAVLSTVFPQAGSQTVHLTVTDAAGAVRSTNLTFSVAASAGPGSTGSSSNGNPTALYLAAAALVLGIAGVAAAFLLRRTPQRPPPPDLSAPNRS